MSIMLSVRSERWPIAGGFTISRGSKTEAEVVVAELSDGTFTGRGECTPYPRYGETVAGVAASIARFADDIRHGLHRAACSMPCRPAPRAMRSTAPSSISKQSAPIARRTNYSDWPHRGPASPPSRFRSARRSGWLKPPLPLRPARC